MSNKVFTLGREKISLNEIYDAVLKKKDTRFKDYEIIRAKNYFLLLNNHEDKVISFSEKQLKLIIKNYKEQKEFSIYSSIEIDELIKKLKNPYIIYENEKKNYQENCKLIFTYIENNCITIYDEEKEFKNLSQNTKSLHKQFTPLELSENFYKYFKYNDSKENNIFEYYETEERDLLNNFLLELKVSNSLNIFKFTGPSSIGKTTSLLTFRRKMGNSIYLNLKILNELKNEYVDSYNLIISECFNLYFNTEKIKKDFIDLLNDCKGKKHWEIIKEIIYFHKKNLLPLMVIMDQYKKNNVDQFTFDEIIKKIEKTQIKIIICSSINNRDIQLEVIKTLKTFRGNPNYNECTQHYFFYFPKLFDVKKENNELNDLLSFFGHLPKYSYLLTKNKSDKERLNEEIDEIQKHILKKIKEFYSGFPKIKISDCLLFLISIIGEKIDYNYGELDIIPLKYFVLELNEDHFKIDYFFPFVKKVIKKEINFLDAVNYFKNKEIEENNFFKSKIKWAYFEYYVKYCIENKILKLDVDCNVKLLLKTIIDMDCIIEDDIKKVINQIFQNEKENCENFNLIRKNNNKENTMNEEETIIPKEFQSKTIDDYKKEFNKTKNIELISGYENSNLILEQEKGRGDCIDEGFLFKKNKRIFLGFQMKFYSKNSHDEGIVKIKKDLIKDNYYKKLLNSKYLLGIDIEEWHYAIVVYYNKKDKIDGPYCKNLINHCNNNGIEYIFFNPVECKFYDRNEKEITKFLINDYSNLDTNLNYMLPNNIINNPMENVKNKLFLQKKTFFSSVKNLNEEYKNIYNSLLTEININENNKKNKMKKFLSYLENSIKGIKNIILVFSYEFFEDEYLPSPAENYLFLFKKKNSNNFIVNMNKNNTYYFIDLENKKNLDYIDWHSLIDKKNKKFYVFKFKIDKSSQD